jgi:hypothetical protein
MSIHIFLFIFVMIYINVFYELYFTSITRFLKITQTKSITRAAELHLTQPAVSIQLRNFQDQLKFHLRKSSVSNCM